MNAKLRKLVKITAAGVFLIALAININVTLEDPFATLSEQALALETTVSGEDTTSGLGDLFNKKEVCKGDYCEDANLISFRARCSSKNESGKCVNGEWVIVINGPQ